MFDPERTQPGIPRGATPAEPGWVYDIPSCPACFRMAQRRGVNIGQTHSIFGFGEGAVEAVGHTTKGVVVLVSTPDQAVWVDLEELSSK